MDTEVGALFLSRPHGTITHLLVINHVKPPVCVDIAVGAPFDGDGKVFIYRGSDAGIETKPAQVKREPP